MAVRIQDFSLTLVWSMDCSSLLICVGESTWAQLKVLIIRTLCPYVNVVAFDKQTAIHTTVIYISRYRVKGCYMVIPELAVIGTWATNVSIHGPNPLFSLAFYWPE